MTEKKYFASFGKRLDDKDMRNLLVTLDYFPSHGGVARYYTHLLEALRENGADVLAPAICPQAGTTTPAAPRVYRRTLLAQWVRPQWLPMLVHMAWLIIRGYRCIWVGQVLPVGTAALILSKIFRIRYLVFTHGLDITGPKAGTRRAKLRDAVLRFAWLVTANSEYTKQCLRSIGVPDEKILLLRPGCSFHGTEADMLSVKAMREQLKLTGDQVFLTVARLVRRKGVDTVLDALGRLQKEVKNFQYIIVGDGPERPALERQVRALRLGQRVHFLGVVEEALLPVLYSLCDVFILTPHAISDSRDPEGYGIVYLEANAFGKPVIGSRTGGVPEAVQNGVTGILVAPDGSKALADVMKQLLHDESLRLRMGQNGKQFVLEQCQWSQRALILSERLQYRP